MHAVFITLKPKNIPPLRCFSTVLEADNNRRGHIVDVLPENADVIIMTPFDHSTTNAIAQWAKQRDIPVVRCGAGVERIFHAVEDQAHIDLRPWAQRGFWPNPLGTQMLKQAAKQDESHLEGTRDTYKVRANYITQCLIALGGDPVQCKLTIDGTRRAYDKYCPHLRPVRETTTDESPPAAVIKTTAPFEDAPTKPATASAPAPDFVVALVAQAFSLLRKQAVPSECTNLARVENALMTTLQNMPPIPPFEHFKLLLRELLGVMTTAEVERLTVEEHGSLHEWTRKKMMPIEVRGGLDSAEVPV